MNHILKPINRPADKSAVSIAPRRETLQRNSALHLLFTSMCRQSTNLLANDRLPTPFLFYLRAKKQSRRFKDCGLKNWSFPSIQPPNTHHSSSLLHNASSYRFKLCEHIRILFVPTLYGWCEFFLWTSNNIIIINYGSQNFRASSSCCWNIEYLLTVNGKQISFPKHEKQTKHDCFFFI